MKRKRSLLRSQKGRTVTKIVFILAIAGAAVMGALALSVQAMDSPEAVQSVGSFANIIGLGVMILGGIAFASRMSSETDPSQAKTTTTPIGSIVFGLIGAASLWVSNGNLIVLLIAAGAFGLAYLSWNNAKSMHPTPKWLRYLMILGAFLGGAVPGLIVWFILSFIISDRYCQLTSSKCL
ncbi:MAG TPA: hypothetical protein VHQ86_05910 [Candidatus Saccharimonadia bacterium]|jgi:hypothetical protein|nr:hypothetical protein [Candidatus Saccharimonadia bacterium]